MPESFAVIDPFDARRWGRGNYAEFDPARQIVHLGGGKRDWFAIDDDCRLTREEARRGIARAFKENKDVDEKEASDLVDRALRGLRYLDWVEARQRHFGVAWTHGIRVETTTQFLLRMDDGNLLFAYRVRVSNHGDRQRQLVGRYLRFTDSAGGVIEVPRGSPGVVGHTPILAPDQCFEYVSGATQEGGHGTMLGSFQMIDVSTREPFDVDLPTVELYDPDKGSHAGEDTTV